MRIILLVLKLVPVFNSCSLFREEAELELQQIAAQMQIDRTLPSSYWTMFKKRSYRKRTLLCLGTTCGIQSSCILAINDHSPILYGTLSYDGEEQLILLGGWFTLAFGCGVILLFIVDHFPRPNLIGGGIAACMVRLIGECALVAQFVGTTNTAALKAAVAMSVSVETRTIDAPADGS